MYFLERIPIHPISGYPQHLRVKADTIFEECFEK